MRTETITRELYPFSELSDESKEKAIEYYRGFDDTEFIWENLREDASENASFKLTSVNDNPISAEGSFREDVLATANRILSNCGETCDIHAVAKAFLAERDEAVETAIRDENGDLEDESALDDTLDDIERDFEANVAHEFAKIWSKELEYAASDEAITETIEANEYEFLHTGVMA